MVPFEGWPDPQPDVDRLLAVLRREKPDRVPLFELAIAEEILAELAGQPLPPPPAAAGDHARWNAWAAARIDLWRRLGYDYFRARVDIPFTTDGLSTGDTAGEGRRNWVNEHSGVIRSAEDFTAYPWPTPDQIGYGQTEAATRCVPAGMGVIGFSGGVLEWASTLMGLEHFMMALYDQPDLVRAVVDRVGQTILTAFEGLCRIDGVTAIWLGDDMGFKTSTLIAPDQLREYILPWHARYARLAHEHGRPFILHSCGQIEAVMPDLVESVRIDGRHSYEDVIDPIERVHARWGHKVAVLGGVDVDLLARGTPQAVRRRTREILNACAPAGGYACGSGNSVTNYVPIANYLAMVETVHAYNGRMEERT